MKKLLVMLLVASMSFSVVACVGNDSVTNHERNQDSTDSSTNTSNDETENEKTTESESVDFPTNQYEQVEITIDNWQDYFELQEKLFFVENGFGEFDYVRTDTFFMLKDGIIINEEKSEVTFECVPVYECKPYMVDVANKTIIYGATTETKNGSAGTGTMIGIYYDGEEYIYGERISGGMYDELQGNTYVLTGIDVSRITGSICIQY